MVGTREVIASLTDVKLPISGSRKDCRKALVHGVAAFAKRRGTMGGTTHWLVRADPHRVISTISETGLGNIYLETGI